MDRREALSRVAALVGGLSASTITGVLGGCGTERGNRSFIPQTLTGGRDSLVATLAEHILPRTDTPGARDALVHEFIDTMLSEWFETDDRSRFLEGLSLADSRAQEKVGLNFMDLTEQEQRTMLVEWDRESYTETSTEGATFFREFKALTLLGYYTSSVGGTQELQQMPMGIYRGDVPYAEIGRAWA